MKKQQRAEQKTELAAEDHVAIAASTEQVRQHFMSLRELTSGMISRGEDVLTARIGKERSRDEKQCAELREAPAAAVQDPVILPHAAADALRDSLLQHDPELPMNMQRNMHQVQSGVDLLTAAQYIDGHAVPVQSAGVNVKSGKALPMFDAISWAYSFVEFFYGDTVPNHPLRTSHGKNNSHFKSVGWQRHFATLAVREELEYTLGADAVPYNARQMSHFDILNS